MVNVANEWADAACNSVVWLKNIRDGISTPEEALKEMEANIARIRASSNLHCTVPPEGWSCSREPGHEGPCAASPVGVNAKDAVDTLIAVLEEIGYTQEFAAAHPDMKVSDGVRMFIAQKNEDLALQLKYMKAVHAEEKSRREALEADLAKVNSRLTGANIGLTMAQAAAKLDKFPQAICNADTKRDPELRDFLTDKCRAQIYFNEWYKQRYGNPDLTDTWKHAAYQDANEVWTACVNVLSAEYTQRARNWRDSFDAMHRRAMTAEQAVKDQEICLSGERGQVEIWKQRAKEWCEKFHDLERAMAKQKTGYDLLSHKLNYVAGITTMGEDREEFLRWWCIDVPQEHQKQYKEMADDCLQRGHATDRLVGAWEGYQFGLNRARSIQASQEDKAKDPLKIFQVFLPESGATDVHKWFDVSEESYQQHKLVGRIHRIIYRASPQEKAALTNDKATELVKAYGRAVIQRNGFLVASTMQDILAYLVGIPLTNDVKECLEDVISHHDDFVKACEFAKLGESGEDGVSYWTHQVSVLNRMKEQAESALDNVGDESHHSHLKGGSL